MRIGEYDMAARLDPRGDLVVVLRSDRRDALSSIDSGRFSTDPSAACREHAEYMVQAFRLPLHAGSLAKALEAACRAALGEGGR